MGAKKISEIAVKQLREASDVKINLTTEDIEGSDEKNRFLEFSFSSEVPYKRWYGYEIISHEEGAINFERLKNKAPLLFNHDWDKQLGVVVDAWIKEKRGFVKVKLSRSEFAAEKIKDIDDEILTSASFGYMIEEMILTKQSDEEYDEYTVTKCMPYEVSLVTVPADTSVGVGRSIKDNEEKIQIRGIEAPLVNQNTPPIQINEPAVKAAITGGNKMDPVEQERSRIKTIQALGEKFDKKDLASNLVNSGATMEQANEAFLKELNFSQKPANDNSQEIDLSEKDKKNYSFSRAIHALVNPNDSAAQKAAAFELECSREAAKKHGQESKGVMIPVDMLRHRRDLLVGTPTAGGNLVGTDLMSMSFIDLLRAKAVLMRSGAQVLSGLKGNVGIPKHTGAATAYWVAENGSPTESQQSLGQVGMSPKTIAAYTDFSRQLVLQSSLDVESFVRSDLARVIALGLDYAGFYGLGASNQPLGLVGQTGLNIVDITGGSLAATESDVIDMEALVAADNAEVDFMKYIMNTATRGALKKKPIEVGQTEKVFGKDGMVNSRMTEVSNQIAAGDLFYGNWQDLIIGMWGGLDLIVDPFTQATAGTVRVVVHQSADIAARHGESFCRGYDATP